MFYSHTNGYHTNDFLVKYMISKLNIKSTDKCYDPVCGFGRFLIGFAQTTSNLQFIQNNIFGNEINNNVYRSLVNLFIANNLESCLLNINNTNSLTLTQHETMREKFDIIAADIPYGSNNTFVVDWFPINSKYIHINFMQHIFFSLKSGGKAAVIIPTRILSNNTDIEISLRKLILECCQITEIIDLPTVSTPIPRRSIIFFTKYRTTTNIKYTKYNSMNNLGLFYHDCSIKNIPIIDIIANDYKIVFE
jgi:type I restriction enzyme M protein